MMTGSVAGSVRLLLRLEGLMVLAASVYVYVQGGHSWWLFAALCLLPDATFAAYLAGPRVGAGVYNAAHSYVAPLVLAIAALAAGAPLPTAAPLGWALIWMAHIGFDRAAGYGLKYPTAFGDTHLGRIGKRVVT